MSDVDPPPPARQPFGARISDERPPSRLGPLGASVPGMAGGEVIAAPLVVGIVKDEALQRLEPARIRFERLGERTRAWIVVGAGALLTLPLWTTDVGAPGFMGLSARLSLLLSTACLAGAALVAYGVMMSLVPPAPPPPSAGDRFGGVLVEARAQMLWKIRLAAVAVAIVHWWIWAAIR